MKKSDHESMNNALRLIRVYHDLSKTEAATRVGLSKSYVSELESGQKKVTLDVLEKYAEGFDIPLSSLMIFAEGIEGGGQTGDMEKYVAAKVIKMLDWLDTITEDKHERIH